jgi:hypothetical protein
MNLNKYKELTTDQINSEKKIQLINLKIDLLTEMSLINNEAIITNFVNDNFLKGRYFQTEKIINIIDCKLKKLDN